MLAVKQLAILIVQLRFDNLSEMLIFHYTILNL